MQRLTYQNNVFLAQVRVTMNDSFYNKTRTLINSGMKKAAEDLILEHFRNDVEMFELQADKIGAEHGVHKYPGIKQFWLKK